MFLAAAFRHARDGILEDFFAELPHFAQDGLKPSMGGDGLFIEHCLLGGEGQSEGLGLTFPSETPGSRRLKEQRALSDPAELEHFVLETLVARLQPSHGRCG